MHTSDESARTAHAASAPSAAKADLAEAPLPTGKARTGGLVSAAATTLSALAAAALAACGGGGGDDTSGNKVRPNEEPGENPSTNPPGGGDNGNDGQNPNTNPNSNNKEPSPPPPRPTETEAARFLMQASFGGTYAQVEEVQNKGYAQWIDEQMAKPWDPNDSHYQWLYDKGYFDARSRNVSGTGIDNTLWRKLMTAPDVLRQRVAFALSQIFVVGLDGLGAVIFRNVSAAAYMDLLEKHAFGNYADLLNAVSTSPAMGTYLNMKGSRAQLPNSANQPDENYAREVMQLFSIGLYELNEDGTEKSQPKETYTQENVTQLARIFTGWNFESIKLTPTRTREGGSDFPYEIEAPFSIDKLDYFNQPMAHNSRYFTSGSKPFFNQTVDASKTGPQALKQVIDYLASHPNVGPFIGKQLIQRLVCSNPSPAYVKDITGVFNNDGKGVRGNLKAVIKAILLHTEARALPAPGTDAYKGYGKLREPALRLVQWARTFNVKSNLPSNATVIWPAAGSSSLPIGPWNVGDLSDDGKGLGQSPLHSPSVFNFYRPGYIPPQGDLGERKVIAPEFQLTNEVTVATYLNLMRGIIDTGRGTNSEVMADYSGDYTLATDASALVNRHALLLTANALSDVNKAAIIKAVNAITTKVTGSTPESVASSRIKLSIFLIMATPEYLIQK
jgi:uncharacterized protein (DUF1800 family)